MEIGGTQRIGPDPAFWYESTNVEKAPDVPEVQKTAETHQEADSTFASEQLNVSYDRESGKYITKIVAVPSGEVIKEIPAESLRRIAAEINRYLGVILDKKR
jgi:uncharacterized FlaG/YvyC family protein